MSGTDPTIPPDVPDDESAMAAEVVRPRHTDADTDGDVVRTTSFKALADGHDTPGEDDMVFALSEYIPEWVDESVIDRRLPTFLPSEAEADQMDEAYNRVYEAASADPNVDDADALAWEQVYGARYKTIVSSARRDSVIDLLLDHCAEQTVWFVGFETSRRHSLARILAEHLTEVGDATLFQRPGFGGSIAQVCDEDAHSFIPNPNTRFGRICERCNISEETLLDDLGHDTWGLHDDN